MNAHVLRRFTAILSAVGILLGAAACGPTRPVTTESDTLATAQGEHSQIRHVRQTRLAADAYFAFGRAELSDEGKTKLDELAAQVPGKEDPRIQITGYTDRIGDERYNMELAMQRAEAVRDYLVERGIEAEFIDVSALGPHDPIVNCAGRSGRSLIQCLAPNRRTIVEFSAFEVLEDGVHPAAVNSH